MTTNQDKLIKVLQEIFQLNRSDLDFGIYRILNSKSDEINDFLQNDLLSSVAKAFSTNENSTVQAELDEAIKQAQALGVDADTIPKVQELKEKLSFSSSSSSLENEVFSHLANFFKRYYKDGDFVSLRRYKKDTYAIPYEGEEVKLHWANSDQYYIKSGEYFRDYTFKVNGKTIHLKLSDAETESNNNKATSDKERRFVILENKPCEVIDDELYINFEYKAIGKENQDKLNEKAIVKALESIEDLEFITALNELARTEKNKKRTIFEKHLKNYTSRNSFDYFIHKDLGGFLSRELDFYIKNEMLFLDDIMYSPIKYEEVMGKVKIFKEVSQKIISFLTQLEELQKKLWEKKKFIIETNYCITLDKIDEDYYEQILACSEQLAEWKDLFDVDVQSIDDLKEEKYLVLDTKFFDMKFKYSLLSKFDNLDEDIDGVLINSENFGALNLLQDRYKEKINTIYIDPPYNTGNDGFIYNDTYQHSSWMSFLYDRLALGRELMSNDGVVFSSIDDGEENNLIGIKNTIFGKSQFVGNFVWKRRQASGKQVAENYYSQEHEYLVSHCKDEKYFKFKGVSRDRSSYTNPDNDPRGDWAKHPLDVGSTKEERPNCFYTIIDPKTGIGYEASPKRVWAFAPDSMAKLIEEEKILFHPEGKTKPYLKKFWTDLKSDTKPISSWISYGGELIENDDIVNLTSLYNTEGTKQISSLFGDKVFDTVKPHSLMKSIIKATYSNIILDFFAGSGTTGHSIINLNREEKDSKKYILVEMGEYFNTVTKPRIQKVIYSDSWKDGKPTTKNGISQVFKYFKLESYEDTLNNLEFKTTEEQQKTMDYYPQAKEDYILNYSLDVESQASLLNINTFSTPFDYKLKIATSSVGETNDTTIDLVETFNYLLGLVVKRIEMLKGYLVVEGQNLKKEKILIIWRDGQSSDELNEFFKKMDWSVYDREFDTIYVNGDNNLANLQVDEDQYKVKLIEQEFQKLMFNGKDI